jgi:GDP-L-fucose synthase
MLNQEDKIFIAGIHGMVGSGINRALINNGYKKIVGLSSKELDLRDQKLVEHFFEKERPGIVFLAAAKVGGIQTNNELKAEFLYNNLMIQSNIIHAAYKTGVKKLLFMGSSCVYPKMADQPIKEMYLLNGELEPTNEPYAIAKIAGIKMCDAYRAQYGCNFISAMPTNLYGPNDHFNVGTSHVLPALLKKMHDAKIDGLEQVEIWGTGNPLREFLHVDDLATACLVLMDKYDEPGAINVGSGQEISIAELAELIKDIVGFKGSFYFNTAKPDGTPRKLLDSSKMRALGWKPSIELRDGIGDLYKKHFL